MKLLRKNGLRATALGALAVSGALVLTACGSDNNSASPSGSASSSAAGTAPAASGISCDGAKGQLLAAGSSAQANAMNVWIKNYSAACTAAQVNYKASSSGEGVTSFNNGQLGFAGSDGALKPEEITASQKVCAGGQGIDLPMVGGPIAIGYHLEGVDNLILNADTIAKIFKTEIKKWNDPAIAALNPGVKLPATPIQAFHRSEDSGTTQNLNRYLNAAGAADWKYPDGKSWPAPGGQGASGSAGVAQQVKQTNGAIGYFELSYATSQQISTVKIDTGASAPVEATSDNASKAIAAAKVVGTGDDLALSLDYNTKVDGAYPIILVTYEIVCDKGNKADTLGTVKSFLTYTSSEEGQKLLTDQGYAPIPDAIISKVRSTVATLS